MGTLLNYWFKKCGTELLLVQTAENQLVAIVSVV